MNRDDLINKIKNEIEKEEFVDVEKEYILHTYKNYKNGIYFLYDENDIVIYVGAVGKGKNTSFAHRMYLHGNGAHCRKVWFCKVKKFRFKSFPKLTKKQLMQVERLMIYANKQPAFNDCYSTEDEYVLIANNL